MISDQLAETSSVASLLDGSTNEGPRYPSSPD